MNSHIQTYRSDESEFCRAMVSTQMLSPEQMQAAAERFHLGALSDGRVIFWYIDSQNQVRSGKLMHYQPDGHRRKNAAGPDASWFHDELKRNGQLPADFHYQSCLFGLHQLPEAEAQNKPIRIVESEKTAIILSQHFPQYIWMATGGLSMLNSAQLLPLIGQPDIVIFPDTDPDGKTYNNWYKVAQDLTTFLPRVQVSRYLEDHATAEQKAQKIDLADLLHNS